ncbi:Modulator of FtsH protease HflC [Candidatus Westeberhardia cardiocondylae]|uniref:Protein HflC n=1 Tax=Candidatus Westeberhardia cardiocondylae TaxID=1594731 RepID=A0A0H5BWP4_9ENTR|nr:protease modulator HflC [Candidatus Westeberhardia cardiocondylae]MCR3756403.1 regulator of FtsH protease [Candidatus Westeberhardia cardiocondylae]CEN32137.1 Modulator of FtsH protease HflC [Candidatus Westeberhardia cardiocondylae]
MRNSLFIAIFVVLIMFLYSSCFIVCEGQCGMILRFGKVLRNKNNDPLIYNPGLHMRIPLLEKVKTLDIRIQTMENQADRFVTMEKKDLIIDSYIKWKISDFNRYYLATGGGDISQAEILLRRKFSDRLRSELGKLDVKGIVTDSRNKLMSDVRRLLNYGTIGNNNEKKIAPISFNYKDVHHSFYKEENFGFFHDISNSIFYANSMAVLGIEVVDVRIKQINLPTEVSDAIYQRMRAEREAVARRHRSQGQEEAEKLRAVADYEVIRTLSEAEHQALVMRGEADAEIAKIYASSFNKDPNFYIFIRMLRAYENSFNDRSCNDMIILDLKSDFFRFMKLYNGNMKH